MLYEVSLLAATHTIWSRLGIFAFTLVFGAVFILAGIQNIKTRTAEESGKRRFVNSALGVSNTYKGTKAVVQGYIRVVCGVGLIIFGIVFSLFGS